MHVVITSTIVSVIQLKLYILISSFLYILRVSFTYIKNNAPELICDEEIHLGTLDNSRLLEWDYYDVQSFVKNLFQYAILRDEIRKKFKRKRFRTKK